MQHAKQHTLYMQVILVVVSFPMAYQLPFVAQALMIQQLC